VALGLLVGAGVGDAVGDAVGEGCPEGLGDADGVTCGLGVALLDGEGEGDGVTFGSGPTLRFGTMLPMRGRSACGPAKGAFWLGEDTTSATTAAAAASPVSPSGTAIGRLRSGRAPVFCGDRAYARRSGVRMMPSAATGPGARFEPFEPFLVAVLCHI
jgi:hypothetical protein